MGCHCSIVELWSLGFFKILYLLSLLSPPPKEVPPWGDAIRLCQWHSWGWGKLEQIPQGTTYLGLVPPPFPPHLLLSLFKGLHRAREAMHCLPNPLKVFWWLKGWKLLLPVFCSWLLPVWFGMLQEKLYHFVCLRQPLKEMSVLIYFGCKLLPPDYSLVNGPNLRGPFAAGISISAA